MSFDQDKFAKSLHKEFEGELSFDEVKELLDINYSYDFETPISTGKQLVLNRISFFGEKKSEEHQAYSGDQISYSERLDTGINIWIADNLKGKSSIFKIITFALTGNNKLKSNLDNWISDIILNFSISEKKYTIYLDNNGRLNGALYHGSFETLEELESQESKILFEENSKKGFRESIENFFFDQFSYYSLKWTQKSSRKDKNELLESSATWKTYFKSIFLESKDSNSLMYGGQQEKVFQMLLGLQLTYPINRLSIKKDMLEFESAKKKSDQEENKQEDKKETLEEKLNEINLKLSANKDNEKKLSKLSSNYNSVLEKLENRNAKAMNLENDIGDVQSNIESIKKEKKSYKKELSSIRKEIKKSKRKINDLREYLEIDAFFSNIDVKKCPSCDKELSSKQKKENNGKVKCTLCHEEYNKSDRDFDRVAFDQKIEALKRDIGTFKNKRDEVKGEIESLQNQEDKSLKKYHSLQKKKNDLEPVNKFRKELDGIQDQIDKIKSERKEDLNKDELVSQKAVIQYKLEQIKENRDENSDNYEQKISLLSLAIERLNELRLSRGEDILNRLKNLMLSEMQEFGLTSVSEIKITESFQIRFKQDGDFIGFGEIVEGEQLRAKIAFYLSLIQLDIEYSFGRHTRFLIIDSPGKEEADSTYLRGFSNVLKSIEERFGDDLQILIGTAERELQGVVENEKVTPENKFIF